MRTPPGRFFFRVPRFSRRQALALAIDAVLIALAVYGAFSLRFDGYIPSFYVEMYLKSMPAYIAVLLLAVAVTGLYANLWKYAGMADYLRLNIALTGGAMVAVLVTFFIGQSFPRSVYIISWLIICVFLTGHRLAFRLNFNGAMRLNGSFVRCTKRTLFYGAGDAGAMIARELQHNRSTLTFYPLGFIDDDPQKWGLRIYGLKVLGGRKLFKEMIAGGEVDELTITMPSASRSVLREITFACRMAGVVVKTLPALHELINTVLDLQKMREIRMEDLLGRESVLIDTQAMSEYIKGKTVLVTGAGGSIGSELCRQVAVNKPQRLLILDHCENAVYEIHKELSNNFPLLNTSPIVADIRNATRLEQVFSRFSPKVVFHAAAHKHVPMMESNIDEAVENNILGTRILAEAAHRYECERFVLISSDKAVNPAGVMGATKRVAEIIIQHLAQCSSTRFCAVRFGNVLDSRGSVLPLFREQINKGGPVTVTHPDMTRYFMTISEAVQLVLQAGTLGKGGEIFLLDMGEPVRILELAEEVIRLSGYRPYRDIDIEITVPRPGEKICEELYHADTGLQKTLHERIYLTTDAELDSDALRKEMRSLGEILGVDPSFILQKQIRLNIAK